MNINLISNKFNSVVIMHFNGQTSQRECVLLTFKWTQIFTNIILYLCVSVCVSFRLESELQSYSKEFYTEECGPEEGVLAEDMYAVLTGQERRHLGCHAGKYK